MLIFLVWLFCFFGLPSGVPLALVFFLFHDTHFDSDWKLFLASFPVVFIGFIAGGWLFFKVNSAIVWLQSVCGVIQREADNGDQKES